MSHGCGRELRTSNHIISRFEAEIKQGVHLLAEPSGCRLWTGKGVGRAENIYHDLGMGGVRCAIAGPRVQTRVIPVNGEPCLLDPSTLHLLLISTTLKAGGVGRGMPVPHCCGFQSGPLRVLRQASSFSATEHCSHQLTTSHTSSTCPSFLRLAPLFCHARLWLSSPARRAGLDGSPGTGFKARPGTRTSSPKAVGEILPVGCGDQRAAVGTGVAMTANDR